MSRRTRDVAISLSCSVTRRRWMHDDEARLPGAGANGEHLERPVLLSMPYIGDR
jgi:hypothetical protein